MNILYIHRTQGKGVEGVHIWSIIDSFKKLGHKVNVISPGKENDIKCKSKSDSNQQRSKANISFSHRVFHFFSRNVPEILFEIAEIIYNIFALRDLKQFFKKEKIQPGYFRF